MIPRQVLFGNPEKSMARISPDGAYLSYLAPVDGVLNVWIAAVEDPDSARPITRDEERGIRHYDWTYDGQHILYYQDARGDEDWHVYATNITTGETRDLTPFEKVNSQILSVNEKTPNEILIGINTRNPQLHDVYRIELSTGERTLIEENPGFVSYLFDNDDRTRFAIAFSPIVRVDQIQRPLLIGQGANDPRVKQIESDQIVGAMKEKNIPVTYVLYPDEGHGFARPENRLSFYAVAEAFLSEHLGGRFEPVGEDFQGSKIQVPEGADQVPGLHAALA